MSTFITIVASGALAALLIGLVILGRAARRAWTYDARINAEIDREDFDARRLQAILDDEPRGAYLAHRIRQIAARPPGIPKRIVNWLDDLVTGQWPVLLVALPAITLAYWGHQNFWVFLFGVTSTFLLAAIFESYERRIRELNRRLGRQREATRKVWGMFNDLARAKMRRELELQQTDGLGAVWIGTEPTHPMTGERIELGDE